MTLRSKWSQQITQKTSITWDSFDAILPTIEVITNSNLVINSIRVLIVVLALLMGYKHSSHEVTKASSAAKTVTVEEVPESNIK
jgi:hypothetical protein